MLKRYQSWTEANPLPDWLLSVGLGLVVFLTLFFLIPGSKKPGVVMLIVVCVLSGPTNSLLKRFSDERRHAHPIPPCQEKGVGLLAVLISVCSIAAYSVCILGKRWGWPVDRVGPLLFVWSVSSLLSFGLGYAMRYRVLGRWAMGLTLGWFALMIVAIIVRLLLTAVGRT